MRRIIIKNTMLTGAAVLCFSLAAPLAVGALPARAQEAQTNAQNRVESARDRAVEAQATAADKKEAAQARLTEAKLKACQNREKAINSIMSRISTRGQKQLDLFTTIADRTEKFYTDKGKTLSNYDALVADVDAKKTAAQTTVDTVKNDSVSFKCDGTDPKGAADSFKADLKSEIAALKDYKTAVKNLIVGVKSVQSTTATTDNTSNTEGSQQ